MFFQTFYNKLALSFYNGEVTCFFLTKLEYLRSSKPVNDTPKFYWDEAEPDADKEKK